MKKILFTILLILILFPLKNAFATVGDPNSYHDFYYNSKENAISMFYTKGGGAWCTGLFKLSIDTQKITTVIPCNRLGIVDEDTEEKIKKIKKDLEVNNIKLKEVDLKKLNINFKSKLKSGNFFEKDGKVKKDLGIIEGDPAFWFSDYHINWEITPVTDNKEKKSFTVPNCVKELPINLTGLASPNHKFLAIVSTSISQCGEMGYPDDVISVIEDVSIPSDAFLGNYNPGYVQDKDYLHKIKPMKGKFHIKNNLLSVLYYLNNTGFQAYKEGSYKTAIYFFKEAYSDKYLLPLFNLAATEAKVGKSDDSFNNLDKLLSYKSTRDHYLKKIKKDSDFDKLRKDKRYLKYFPTETDQKEEITKIKTDPIAEKVETVNAIADEVVKKPVIPSEQIKTKEANTQKKDSIFTSKNILIVGSIILAFVMGVFVSKRK